MTDRTVETSPRLKARIAGVLYVIIIILALFAPFPVAPSALTRGDVAATAAKMLASKSLYTLGGAAELIVYVCDIAVALIFYELLKPVSRELSLLAVAPLLFMSGPEHLTAFTPDQLRALTVTFIRLHTIGLDIALVFFGFHCVIVGYLFFRSTFFPRILGAPLAVAGLCYLINSFASFLSSAFAAHLFPYTLALGVGEILLPLWLLVIGVNAQRW